MKPYIEDLKEEIKEAIREAQNQKSTVNVQKKLANGSDNLDRRNYLYGNPATLEQITGIPTSAIPPGYLVENEQKEELARLMERLLNAWGFIPDFPESFPVYKRYKFLRDIWNTSHVYIGNGAVYIDMCNFDVNNCPFPDHCNMCEKIKEQEKLYNQLIKRSRR
mgnify:CR=1 FL=1